jgi:hypothetical protein
MIEAVGPTPSSVRRTPLDLLVLVAASVLLAVPFLVLHHANTIDGPAHVLGSRILGHLGNEPIVRHYYVVSFTLVPNVLSQLLLAALMVAVSPTWSEKILVAGYVVALPLAVRYAIRSVNPSAGWAALVWLPFVVSFMLLFGFYDFCYAMVGAPIAIGLAIRARGRWTTRRVVGLALVLVATYSAHVVPLVMAVAVIATITAVDTVGEWCRLRTRGRNPAREVFRHTVLPPLVAVLPVCVLVVAFVASGGGGGLSAHRRGLEYLIGGLATLTLPTVSYTRGEIVASLLIAGLLLTLAILAARRVLSERPSRLTVGLAAAFVVCVVVYFAAPDELGTGGYLNDRLSLFPPLLLLLVCTSVPLSPRVWRVAGVVGLVAAVLAAGARLPTQKRYDRLVSEYLTVEQKIPPGSTLVALRYAVFGPPLGYERFRQVDPLAHEASRVAADRGDVDLRHLEGQFAYYPDRFRSDLNELAGKYLEVDYPFVPHVDLLEYNRLSGRPVQYVLVVGLNAASPKVRRDPATRAVERQLASDYVRVMVTSPTGLVELYRHR